VRARRARHLRTHRLLSFDRDPITRGPTVEIAHEALPTEWRRLQEWINDARADIAAERRLALAAKEWSDGEESSDFLFSGGQFTRYASWLEQPPVRLTATETRFLTSSGQAGLVLALVAGAAALREQGRANE
jgi:hypothetical protein